MRLDLKDPVVLREPAWPLLLLLLRFKQPSDTPHPLCTPSGCSVLCGEQMSSIHEAASRGDLEELSRLLSQDPGLVHHRDRRFHDCTPLCQAVIRGQLQAVQLLIDHGADVNAGVTRRGAGTVLVQACAHGNRDVALLLLARGADPVKDDSSRAGALKAAAYGGDEEIVRALLRSGVCDVDGCSGNGRSALWKACCHGHQGAARALLTEGTHARTEREGRAGP